MMEKRCGKPLIVSIQSCDSQVISRGRLVMEEDIAGKVKDIFSEQLGVDAEKVTPDASFTEDLGADSLDAVELIMAIEEAFDIEIPDEEAEKMTTPGDCVTLEKEFCSLCRSQSRLWLSMTLPAAWIVAAISLSACWIFAKFGN